MNGKYSPRHVAGTIIMVTGIVMIVAGGVYQLVNYPWRILSEKFGGSVSMTLPDPAPLTVEYNFYSASTEVQEIRTELPEESRSLSIARPALNLTLIGAIKIPYLGVSENIVEGVDAELQYAVGHVPGTAMPGQLGNCVLAGHRSYMAMHPFMHLPKMRVGDRVELISQGKTYTYEIFEMFEVKPDESWVMQLQPEESHLLTLVTCTPVPSFTHRLICWARLVPEGQDAEQSNQVESQMDVVQNAQE